MNTNQLPPPHRKSGGNITISCQQERNHHPFVSIIIPVYNAEKFLSDTINSIINQGFENFELICVDNGSVDGSHEILEQYRRIDNRIKILKIKENNGPNPARNLGIEFARGKWLMIMDSDDMLTHDALERLVEASHQFPNATVIKGNHNVLLEDGEIKETYLAEHRSAYSNIYLSGGRFLKDIVRQHGVYFAYIFNADLIRKHNIRFNENITANGLDDQSFLLETMLYGKFIYIESPVYIYRRFLGSTSNTVKATQKVINADFETVKTFSLIQQEALDNLTKEEIGKFRTNAIRATLKHIIKSKGVSRLKSLQQLKSLEKRIAKEGTRKDKMLITLYNLLPF